MKNRKHYIVIENLNPKSALGYDKYLVVPDNDLDKHSFGYETKEEAEERANAFNSTYYISDYSQDEVEEYFNAVDFKPLENAINERLGIQLTFNHSHKFDKGEYRVTFKSNEDLCKLPESGILARMLKECYISQFSNAICVDHETGELYIWMTIDFTYKHFSMGSNGCDLCTVYYKDGKWEINFDEDRYKN